MQRMLDLIEATLDADMTPAELAAASGYSLWHFLHLFQREVGMPLCRYRTRRRLAHAIWHISRGMPVTDAALRWGFESHSGFYRAFCKEYGMSPRAFLLTHRVKAPHLPLLKEEPLMMLTREKFQDALTHWGAEYAALPLTPVIHPRSGERSESAMLVGDAWVLKAYRDEHACRLAAQLAEALHHQGMPAARVVPLPGGQAALPMEAGLWMTLCHRLPGEPLRADRLICQPQEGYRIGAALAALHQATAQVADTAYIEDEPYADHLLNWALPRAREALPADFPADYPAWLDALRTLPTALIHRDPNPGNLIDTPAGIGFIDFDLSRRFVRIFDPCCTITAVLSEVFERDDLPWRENWPSFAKAVLAGYDSAAPLTEAEWEAVPTVLLGNEVLCIAAFAGSSKYKAVFDANLRMLPYLLENLPR